MPEKQKEKFWDYIVILLVFAVTGSTAALLPRFFMPWTGIETGTFWYWLVYILLITPVYQVLLLGYAFIFGKFNYFYEKEKKIGRWILRMLGFKRNQST